LTNKINQKKIFIALPAMNEYYFLPETIKCLEKQAFRNFELYVCVNQPDDFWSDKEKIKICDDNQQTINLLSEISNFNVTIIDKASKNKGWKGKKHGVGWARKTLMDSISEKANDDDLILSLDADTVFEKDYLELINQYFKPENYIGASISYYHQLNDDKNLNRAILRYEIYMRTYALNMIRIQSPYAFTAMGSAMLTTVKNYKKIGGMTPKMSGEDFYFLQKLRKAGKIQYLTDTRVFPSNRPSSRVFFGTGPAVIKGLGGDWDSYPIYDFTLFDKISETYKLFDRLFEEDTITPLSEFLKSQFKTENIWEPLRKNFKTAKKFKAACHQKVDGLRILQFLKESDKNSSLSNEEKLRRFFKRFYHDFYSENSTALEKLNFENSEIDFMNKIRDFLFLQEQEKRREIGGL
jgi:glycosyltransferase involved in cell wall biosynthesis